MRVVRCAWSGFHELCLPYHDQEWGVPVHDDRLLFEMLNLEGAQAGLNWLLILQKRENYKLLFDNFDAEAIARYTDEKLESLLKDPRIIRNRLKVFGVRSNAIAYLEVKEEFGSLNRYLWRFVENKPIINKWKTIDEIPVNTPESDAMSKELKKRGFKFIGTTICYAFMQSIGMVNDHTTDCFRYKEIVHSQQRR
jgi:DNA-3-methyladenine glycosylase I